MAFRILIVIGFLLTVLTGCDEGSDPSEAKRLTQASASLGSAGDVGAIQVVREELKSELRISRTVWRYTYRVRVKNTASVPLAARVILSSVGQGTTVQRAVFETPGVLPGAENAEGEVEVLHDRTFPIALGSWTWKSEDLPIRATVELARDVPPAARVAVARLVSPLGSGPLNTPLALAFNTPSRRALVLAVDQSGHILLAAVASSPAVVLSADSTAIALALFLRGKLADASEYAAFTTFLRGASGFASLVQAVNRALAAGVTPFEDQATVTAASTLLAAYGAQASALTGRLAERRVPFTVVPAPRVNQLPFEIVPDTVLGIMPVAITDVCGEVILGRCESDSSYSDLAVKNATPIHWAVSTTRASDGVLLSAKPLPPSATTLATWLAALSSPLPGTTAVGLPTGDRPVNLVVRQTDESRATSAADVFKGVMDLVIEFMPVATCSETVIQGGLKALLKSVVQLGKPPTLDKFVEEALEEFSEPSTVIDLLATCGADRAGPAAEMGVLLLKQLFDEWKKVTAPFKVSLTAATFGYLRAHWDADPLTIGVCIDRHGRISNCVSRIEFQPILVNATVGVRLDHYAIPQFLDASGGNTIPPNTLEYSATDGASAILSLNSTSGEALSLAEGMTGVTVLDRSTGVSGAYSVAIQAPSIAPASQAEVSVGQKRVFNIVGDRDGAFLMVAPGGSWRIADETIARIDPFSLIQACAVRDGACMTIEALKTGTTTIFFEAGGSPAARTASFILKVSDGCQATLYSGALVGGGISAPYEIKGCLSQLTRGATYALDELIKLVPASTEIPRGALACVSGSNISGTLTNIVGLQGYCWPAWGGPCVGGTQWSPNIKLQAPSAIRITVSDPGPSKQLQISIIAQHPIIRNGQQLCQGFSAGVGISLPISN